MWPSGPSLLALSLYPHLLPCSYHCWRGKSQCIISFILTVLFCFKGKKVKTKNKALAPELSDFGTCSLRRNNQLDVYFISQDEHRCHFYQSCNKCWMTADGWHELLFHTGSRIRKMTLLTDKHPTYIDTFN